MEQSGDGDLRPAYQVKACSYSECAYVQYRHCRNLCKVCEERRGRWVSGITPRCSAQDVLLQSATRHFSKILGEGGSGTRPWGVLLNGNKVAIKRLRKSRQGEKEFPAEVETIALHHRHLECTWEFCSEGAHRMLVCECMNNGSLDWWLAQLDDPTSNYVRNCRVSVLPPPRLQN